MFFPFAQLDRVGRVMGGAGDGGRLSEHDKTKYSGGGGAGGNKGMGNGFCFWVRAVPDGPHSTIVSLRFKVLKHD